MSHASEARKLRRKVARTGIAKMHRVVVDRAAVDKIATEGKVNARELVAYHISVALEALENDGADVLRHTVVTVGEHPDFPGDLMIEAKAAHMRPDHEPVNDCPGCPLDHSLDSLDA